MRPRRAMSKANPKTQSSRLSGDRNCEMPVLAPDIALR